MNDSKQATAYAGKDLDNAYWLFVQLLRKYFPDLVPNDAILRSWLWSGRHPTAPS